MTNKQRAKIYRRAAEIIFKGKAITDFGIYRNLGCCDSVSLCCNGTFRGCNSFVFSEFFLFQPNDDLSRHSFWWQTPPLDLEPRIIALLLSEQMALNP